MPDFEIYTIANGLSVGPRRADMINAYPTSQYQFNIATKRVSNILYQLHLQFNRDNTGLKSNTDSKLFPSTWHLSIDKDGEPVDPWDLWEKVGFEISKVEVITGKDGAKPWLLSFRRRDATVIQEEKAAIDNYNQRVAFARNLMQQTAQPPPAPSINASPMPRRRSSTKDSTGAGTTEKRRISDAASLASSSSGSSIGKTDKTPKTLVKVTSIASAAPSQASRRDYEKKSWRLFGR